MVKDAAVRHYLADRLCEALFCQAGATRLRGLLRALPPGLACSTEAAVEVMGADPRFVACVTRWDLQHRSSGGSRPFGGALEAILQAYGRPMPRALLINELCLSRAGAPPQFDELLERLLLSGRDVGAFDHSIYLIKWLANTGVADEKSQLFVNGLAEDQAFLSIRAKLLAPALKQRAVLDTAAAVLKLVRQPLPNRALGLVLHHHHGERFAAAEVLAAMAADERFLCLSGPAWLLESHEKTLQRGVPREVAEGEEPPSDVNLDAVLQSPPTQKLRLEAEVLEAALALAGTARTPVSVEELLSDLMHLRPRQRQFAPAAHALEAALNAEISLLRLPHAQYLSRQGLPPWVRTVPETLVPETVPLAPRERPLDVLLSPELLAPGLGERVTDAFYEDQGEPDISLREDAVTETTLPIASHHYRCGTMKLRTCDRRLYDQPGPISLVTFCTPEGRELPIWVNLETRLLYGFLTWFGQALPPVGALVSVRRDPSDPNRYLLQYGGENDPGTYIGRERLAHLLSVRERLRRKRPFMVDVVTALLHGSEKGLGFDQLWSQVNVIRRSTRLLLASTLTHYPQFEEAGSRWRLV